MILLKRVRPFYIILAISFLISCASTQMEREAKNYSKTESEMCPPLKHSIVSQHQLEDFNGCSIDDKFSFTDGTIFWCSESIYQRSFSGTVYLLRGVSTDLTTGCGVESQRWSLLAKYVCESEQDRFEQTIQLLRWKEFDSVSFPINFVGGVKFFITSHRIVFGNIENISYSVKLESDIGLSGFECEMIDSNGNIFWSK